MTSNQFSIRLHEARQMMGLSMEKLAELTGGIITKQSISRYEKGLMLPKRVAKLAMAKALNISDSYFDATNISIDMPMLRTTSNGKLSEDELQALEAKLSFWAEQYLAKEKEAGFPTQFNNTLRKHKPFLIARNGLSGNLVGISINLFKSIQKELFINDTS